MLNKLQNFLKKNIWLILILIMAFFLRCWHLADIPANLYGDEFTQALAARAFLEGKGGSPFSTGWYSLPTLYFFLGSFFLRFLGNGVFAWRFFSVLAGMLTVLMLYLFGKEFFNKKVGLIAAALLSFFHAHIFFSRIGSNQIFDGLFHLLVYYFLLLGIKKEKIVYFVLAGAFLGLSQYFYFGTKIISVISLAVFIPWVLLFFFRKKTKSLFFLLCFLASAFIVFFPLFRHYQRHPQEYLSRINQVNALKLKFDSRKEKTDFFVKNLNLTFLAFWNKGTTQWYPTSYPLVNKIELVFLIIGLLSLFISALKPQNTISLFWFFLTLITGSILAEQAMAGQRITGIFPVICLLIAAGINWATHVFRKREKWFLIVLLVVVIGSINIFQLFIKFLPEKHDPNTTVATEIAYLLKNNRVFQAYLLFNTRMGFDSFSSIPFILPATKREDLNFNEGRLVNCRAAFFVLPESYQQIQNIIDYCPLKQIYCLTRKEPTGIWELAYVYFSPGGFRNLTKVSKIEKCQNDESPDVILYFSL